LPELYVPTYFSSTGSNHDDPLRCPITNSSFDCNTQFNALLGGNAALKPEKSEQYGLGALWEPMAGRSIGVDYWKVEVNDVSAKPHRDIHVGDEIVISRPLGRKQHVRVRRLEEKHIPKAQARELYEDLTPAPTSEEVEMRRMARLARPFPSVPGSPDKRDRRALRRLRGKI